MTFWFTADEHYGHYNIIKYTKRPFANIDTMNEWLIFNHNKVVSDTDTVIHAGDFTIKNKEYAGEIIKQLKGNHIFLKGSHDNWLGKRGTTVWHKTIEDIHIVVCHYSMRTWHRSHYNSWQLYGHSHGKLEPIGKQWDIGVDNNDFYPVSFEQLKEIMKDRPDNFNFIRKNK